MGKDKVEEASRKPSKLRNSRGSKFTADWASVDATLVVQAIAASSARGGALRFGYTRDGGAYALGVLGDGEPYTLYAGSNDDITSTLQEVVDTFG